MKMEILYLYSNLATLACGDNEDFFKRGGQGEVFEIRAIQPSVHLVYLSPRLS